LDLPRPDVGADGAGGRLALARSIWFSFTETNINDISSSRFIGLANYFGEYGLFFNPNYTEGFWASDWGVAIANTFKFSIVSWCSRRLRVWVSRCC